jgi:hypothetical protein
LLYCYVKIPAVKISSIVIIIALFGQLKKTHVQKRINGVLQQIPQKVPLTRSRGSAATIRDPSRFPFTALEKQLPPKVTLWDAGEQMSTKRVSDILEHSSNLNST